MPLYMKHNPSSQSLVSEKKKSYNKHEKWRLVLKSPSSLFEEKASFTCHWERTPKATHSSSRLFWTLMSSFLRFFAKAKHQQVPLTRAGSAPQKQVGVYDACMPARLPGVSRAASDNALDNLANPNEPSRKQR